MSGTKKWWLVSACIPILGPFAHMFVEAEDPPSAMGRVCKPEDSLAMGIYGEIEGPIPEADLPEKEFLGILLKPEEFAKLAKIQEHKHAQKEMN